MKLSNRKTNHMFDLNAYLADDSNLREDCLASIRKAQENGEFWAEAWHGKIPMMRQMKRIKCADGLIFSAQASEYTYCSPRENIGPWSAVEIGFPSQKVDEFMAYAEEADKPTQTVYGWVPVEVVEAVVEKHGGFESAV